MAKPKDVIKQIKKATRRQFSADEKIRIVLEDLRGETVISEICRREGIASSVYYKWSKAFLEAGKNGLTKVVIRNATADEVRQLKQENSELMDKARNLCWCGFISIAYGSGLRRNEILNLTWKNIDFENQLITVVAKKESERLLKWDPKSRRNRVVLMSDESAQLIAGMQLKAKEDFPYIVISPQRLERIREHQEVGTWTPRSPIINNLNKDFRILRGKVGVDECVIHDLRRSVITNWAKKLPIQVVKLAGHSDISTTRKYYLAVRSEDLASANKFLNQILAKVRTN